MDFLAYLVISLAQLTPMGMIQTNIAFPTPTMEDCQAYLKTAGSEIMSASNLQVVQADAKCVEAKELLGEPEVKKETPAKQI